MKNVEKQNLAPPGNAGTGAQRLNDGTIIGGNGGNGGFWGAGGGGGGGLRVNPDGSIEAGGGGAGGAAFGPGGNGGGSLGGGGGGAPGLPPGFFDNSTGKVMMLMWQLNQEYAAEHGGVVADPLPEGWTNQRLKMLGSSLKYSVQDGHATFNDVSA